MRKNSNRYEELPLENLNDFIDITKKLEKEEGKSENVSSLNCKLSVIVRKNSSYHGKRGSFENDRKSINKYTLDYIVWLTSGVVGSTGGHKIGKKEVRKRNLVCSGSG